MIILYVVACSACFSFGAIFMAIFCVAGRSDEQALIDQIDQLKRELGRRVWTIIDELALIEEIENVRRQLGSSEQRFKEYKAANAALVEESQNAFDLLVKYGDRYSRIIATATASMAHNHRKCVQIAAGEI